MSLTHHDNETLCDKCGDNTSYYNAEDGIKCSTCYDAEGETFNWSLTLYNTDMKVTHREIIEDKAEDDAMDYAKNLALTSHDPTSNDSSSHDWKLIRRTVDIVQGDIDKLIKSCSGWTKRSDKGACLHYGGLYELKNELERLTNRGDE